MRGPATRSRSLRTSKIRRTSCAPAVAIDPFSRVKGRLPGTTGYPWAGKCWVRKRAGAVQSWLASARAGVRLVAAKRPGLCGWLARGPRRPCTSDSAAIPQWALLPTADETSGIDTFVRTRDDSTNSTELEKGSTCCVLVQSASRPGACDASQPLRPRCSLAPYHFPFRLRGRRPLPRRRPRRYPGLRPPRRRS